MRLLNLSIGVLVIICVLSIDTNADANDQIALTKLGGKTGPTLKFFYCYSCGYRKLFDEYVNILRHKYPDLEIAGEHFNPPGYCMLFSKILGIAKILIIVLIVSGIDIFMWMGMPLPSLWQWCIDNRFYACAMIFFMCNAIEGQLVSSGAFEIHLNDFPVWSKLETGRIPQPEELFQIINSQLGFMYSDIDDFPK